MMTRKCSTYDEHTPHVELDVVFGFLGLEKVERRALGNEKDGTEFQLTLNGEMLDGQMIFPIAMNMSAL